MKVKNNILETQKKKKKKKKNRVNTKINRQAPETPAPNRYRGWPQPECRFQWPEVSLEEFHFGRI